MGLVLLAQELVFVIVFVVCHLDVAAQSLLALEFRSSLLTALAVLLCKSQSPTVMLISEVIEHIHQKAHRCCCLIYFYINFSFHATLF